jgi:VanZ family protein
MSSVTKASESLPRFRAAWLAAGWLMVLAVAVGSLWPTLPEVGVEVSDKTLHFGAYASLAFVFAGVVERRHWGRVIVGLLLLGAGIELAQAFLSPTRTGEWLDMAANAAGVLAGMLTAALFPMSWCRHVELLVGVGREAG